LLKRCSGKILATEEDIMFATVTKSDLQIQQDVQRELRWDTRIGPTEVGVEVDKGIVTLAGTVNSYAKKFAAIEAAHKVVGVLDVADNLTVHYPGSGKKTDAEIASAVRHSLEWDAFVADQRIKSTVSDGWVTLEGDVEFLREKEDAERAARYLTGVKGVWNRIVVRAKKAEPKVVLKAIEEALERRAEREAERINVEVQGGTVTLSGRVRSWLERNAILRSVEHATGVTSVSDKLRIDPFF
jgi:osmotically-inducible protein OsmY